MPVNSFETMITFLAKMPNLYFQQTHGMLCIDNHMFKFKFIVPLVVAKLERIEMEVALRTAYAKRKATKAES